MKIKDLLSEKQFSSRTPFSASRPKQMLIKSGVNLSKNILWPIRTLDKIMYMNIYALKLGMNETADIMRMRRYPIS